jgi:Protein of unknown function (DUF3486)
VARHQPSKIEKLGPEIVAEINRLRVQHGWEIDDLVQFVRQKGGDVSRTGMGKHVQKLQLSVQQAADRLNYAKGASEALVEKFGDKDDDELARLNIQLLQSQIFDLILQEDVDDDGNVVNKDPMTLMRLSKAIQQLLSAAKMNAERVKEIRKMAVEEERERIKAAMQDAVDRGDEDAEVMERARRRLGFD